MTWPSVCFATLVYLRGSDVAMVKSGRVAICLTSVAGAIITRWCVISFFPTARKREKMGKNGSFSECFRAQFKIVLYLRVDFQQQCTAITMMLSFQALPLLGR